MVKYLPSIILVALIAGCATTSSDSNGAAKAGQKQIQVFPAGSGPSQKFLVLRTLKDDAGEDEEDEITAQFQKTAAKLGGDAIIFKEKKASGMEVVPFGFGKIKNTFLYRVDVVKFE